MSEYRSQTTNFTDVECLIDALIDCGYKREDIEFHDEAVQLYDYHGRATTYLDKNGDKANVIVRRNKIGYSAANDLGFKFNPATKKFEAIVSAFDSGTEHWGQSSERMKTLKDGYNQKVAVKTAKKMGFKYLGKKTVNGKTQMQWLDTRA